MKREWKPGDVGVFYDDGSPLLAAFTDKGWFWLKNNAPVLSVRPEQFRPVVTIDPEDREQVERLWDAIMDVAVIGDMQDALREFADPKPPRPDEPTGLGAVVEDTDGVLWVRAGDDHGGVLDDNWRQTGGEHVGNWSEWERIAAVRVLSEGVVTR